MVPRLGGLSPPERWLVSADTSAPAAIVVGAGACGLSAAAGLAQRGLTVLCVDKGRRPGGRAALRSTPVGDFEHGVAGLSAAEARTWGDQGRPALTAGGDGRWYATPALRTLMPSVPVPGRVLSEVRIAAIQPERGGWRVQADDASRSSWWAPQVLLTMPLPQLSLLWPAVRWPARLRDCRYTPIWTLLWAPASVTGERAAMAATPWPSPALASGHWAHQRPGASGAVRLVAHTRPEWAALHLETSPAAIAEALAPRLGASRPAAYCRAHLWRYARVLDPTEAGPEALAPGLWYAGEACADGSLLGALACGEVAAVQIAAASADA